MAKWEEAYKAGKKPNPLELKKEFNQRKDPEFLWVYEVTKYACQQPFIFLGKAFQGFFQKRTNYPRYKKKGIHDSFYIGGDQVVIVAKQVKIPNLGWVRLREALRFQGKIHSATISCTAGYWFISVSVETSHQPSTCESQAIVGVDLGLKHLATLSNGQTVSNPKPLKHQLRKLKRAQHQLSRKEKNSQNRIKARKRLANLHYRVANVRNDHLHKLTSTLTNQYQKIVIEDLDVSEMTKNKRLSLAIMDIGWYEFRRQLTYKATLKGNQLFIADKWYASSKRCSGCGHIKDSLCLSERVYQCQHCQAEVDRDLNAAKCLAQLLTVSSTGIQACGQDGSVIMLKTCHNQLGRSRN